LTADGEAALRRRIARNVGGFPGLRCYVLGKLATDPAYAATLEILRAHPLPVLDLGCGLGLLAFYLREHGFKQPITGIDTDAKKIARARRAAARHYRGLTFATADAGAESLAPGRAIVLLDVLHYLDDAAQAALLGRLAACLEAGGIAIIRNTPRDQSWRFALTYLEEIWVRVTRWITARGLINFPTSDEIAAPFRARGCAEEIRPLWGATPFNSHLYVFSSPSRQPAIPAAAARES
jgi:2-polyprenyl-3-methyl-5-hydroxy-6-metoxy-1,4-benzoquinol methylase